jgi:hypothetical protein
MNHRPVPGASVVMWAGFLFHRSRSREKKPETLQAFIDSPGRAGYHVIALETAGGASTPLESRLLYLRRTEMRKD